jgi:hypothetical protein
VEAINDLFSAVRQDLTACGLKAKLRDDSLKLLDGLLHADLFVQGERLGSLGVDPEQGPAERALSLATQVQDLLLEGLRDSDGHAVVWPPCRAGHGHPMQPALREGYPHWTCPESTEVAIALGSFEPPDS